MITSVDVINSRTGVHRIFYNPCKGHSTNPDNFIITGREDHGLARIIKESIYINVNSPHSTGMWVSKTFIIYGTRVLFSTLELRINNDNGHANRTPISGHAPSIPPNRHMHRTI